MRWHGLQAAALGALAIASAATAVRAAEPAPRPPPVREVSVAAADGAVLKGSYFAAGAPGPGVILFHQSNRTRTSWESVARQLAAAGIHALTIDNRGHGESGGGSDKWTDGDAQRAKTAWDGDLEAVLGFLTGQAGVSHDVIGLAGAGLLGVDNAAEIARRHGGQVKSLVLISGETFQENLQFLRAATALPGLYVVADDDEYPPTVEAMELLYVTAASPAKKLIHYVAAREAPWLWYEPFDIGKVAAKGGHGTDLFAVHPELAGIIVDWFLTTLVRTPGHAPVDTVASAAVLNLLRAPGGVAEVTRQLNEARRHDPAAQLFPEITVGIIAQDHLRAGEPQLAVETFELLRLAYPDSADANESLAAAYLKNGQPELARRYAAKALALLDDPTLPASSWADTPQLRGEIRRGAEKTLAKTRAGTS